MLYKVTRHSICHHTTTVRANDENEAKIIAESLDDSDFVMEGLYQKEIINIEPLKEIRQKVYTLTLVSNWTVRGKSNAEAEILGVYKTLQDAQRAMDRWYKETWKRARKGRKDEVDEVINDQYMRFEANMTSDIPEVFEIKISAHDLSYPCNMI